MSQILEALNWRYATKMFDANKKVSEAHWKVLRESIEGKPSLGSVVLWFATLGIYSCANYFRDAKKLREVSWKCWGEKSQI
jgi:hypothetical protein